jgi:type 1 glutamine amidotransferase
MFKRSVFLFSIFIISAFLVAYSVKPSKGQAQKPKKLKALIIDGQSNHGIWPKTTAMMKDYLEQTGLFTVDVERTAFAWVGPHNDNDPTLGKEKRLQLLEQYPAPGGKKVTSVEEPKADPDFKPDFSKYDVVISNFGWKAAPWPQETQDAFEKYVKGGGGFLLIHAADNSFGDWVEFNKIIGMGAWGDRNEKHGPFVYYNDANKIVMDTTKGGAGSHGKQYEFVITTREPSHPVTKGMPTQWLHAQDELYDRLRGPAENMKILATAYSDEEKNASPFSKHRGTARHEPMALTVNYGKGRVFHTPLGHSDYSMECVGFMTLFQRGAEWAATGKVTTKIPSDFPTADKVSQRKWVKK